MLLIFITLFSSLFSTTLPCCSSLEPLVEKMEQLAEVRALIIEIQKRGPIQLSTGTEGPAEQFGACWNFDRRVICVYPPFYEDEGRLIGSVLFELHNALSTDRYQYLDRLAAEGKIDRKRYIIEYEYIEYINSLQTASMAQKGVDRKIFPPTAKLPTFSSFQEHFAVQQRAGHCKAISRNYDLSQDLF